MFTDSENKLLVPRSKIFATKNYTHTVLFNFSLEFNHRPAIMELYSNQNTPCLLAR